MFQCVRSQCEAENFRFGSSAFSESQTIQLTVNSSSPYRHVHNTITTSISRYSFFSVVGITMCGHMKLFQGSRPQTLGVKDGKFLAISNTRPNNLSSQANKEVDPSHYIEPFQFTSGSPTDAIQKIKATVESMKRTHVVECTDDYLYVEFSTKLMGFVDDVEFYAKGGIIDVRSASRLGNSDHGVHRKRVAAIRKMWQLSAVDSKM